jgi:hypothetical protein
MCRLFLEYLSADGTRANLATLATVVDTVAGCDCSPTPASSKRQSPWRLARIC